MLRIKIPVGSKKLEAEGDTEAELETAVKVALRVAESWPVSLASHSQVHGIEFSEDDEAEAKNVASPVKLQFKTTPTSYQEYKKTADVRRLAHGLPPSGYMSPKYESLSTREQLRLAICDLIVNYENKEVSASQAIKHLEKTGGRFKSKAKDRPASARQTMRVDDSLVSTGTGWKATEAAIRDFVSRGRLWVREQQSVTKPEWVQAGKEKLKTEPDKGFKDQEGAEVNEDTDKPSAFLSSPELSEADE